jgi:hypothetical protein
MHARKRVEILERKRLEVKFLLESSREEPKPNLSIEDKKFDARWDKNWN